MKNYKWTEQENKLLQEYYYTLSGSELDKILLDPTDKDIKQQVQYLKRRNWSFKT